ncbi:MAG: tRNA pseudouridine(38-40) synthase TruA [Deltaproteobacteria bacterium]|nr:tRNA pseudouridine(38-40) synthase TruA [Deltaproteobacteria bacterium]MBP7285555.1 tRNA pseudouridine(38-40) synthase TruA [Nannocystaceae bacterium]
MLAPTQPSSTLLRVAYDGTDFHGWARQPAHPAGPAMRTVQGTLEDALSRLCRAEIRVRGASRTDAGVHARGQVAAFECPVPIPCANLVRALDDLLPADVAVTDAWTECPAPIEPRHHNDGKHYCYRIRTAAGRDPMTARYQWLLGRPLELAPMRAAAAVLVGTHDFAAFRSSACQATSTERTIFGVELREHGALLELHVRGTAFLHNMVRIIAGTLVEIGLGRGDAGRIERALAAGDRRLAGRTAPAAGLELVEVSWPGRTLAGAGASLRGSAPGLGAG